jgi:LmbE family N-acetylglucosaminyl deacetylase
MLLHDDALKKSGNVLCLGAHPDDIEFGAGGTLNRLLKRGWKVHMLVFSKCAESVPRGYPPDQLVSEFQKSMRTYGIRDYNILDYRVRWFPSARQGILEDLVRIRNERDYDIVISSSHLDLHQDHATLGSEVRRAFQNTTVFQYEISKNRHDYHPNLFVELSAEDLRSKLRAIKCYRSQNSRKWTSPLNIEGLARVRGMQADVEFAEAFEISKMLWRDLR